jgi:glucose-1-phosphate thymidylyltransferase
MKGIILAGGSGTRLRPVTDAVSKQLLPVFDKPMVFYPLSILMLSNIKEILLISSPKDLPYYHSLLGNGSDFGISLTYVEQDKPEGIPQAFLLGESFIGSDSVCLILGDNIFYGQHLSDKLIEASNNNNGATIFAYHVNDPERFGVVTLNDEGRPIKITEKPVNPDSHFAVTGLYYYDNNVVNYVKELEPSPRGELEITDINLRYLEDSNLEAQVLGRGFTWLDTGTFDSLLQASNFIQTVQERQGLYVACLEEIAYRKGWITSSKVIEKSKKMSNTSYGLYLQSILEE